MKPRVLVKVIGFRDVERHTLNTIFRLSAGRPLSYGLWTPESKGAPRLSLVDLESYQAGLELSSPDLDLKLKMICVGAGAPDHAWRTFARPLQWPDLVAAMDSLFATPAKSDASIKFASFDQTIKLPAAFKAALLVDPVREARMYLRARLALAGHTQVDEAESAVQALEFTRQRHYDLIVVALDLPGTDGWDLVGQLVNREPALGQVAVSTLDKSWQMHERAEKLGCFGLLEKPFDPLQVINLLQKI